MKQQFKKIISDLKSIYNRVEFDIVEEKNSIQLLCNNKELCESEEYLDKVCEIAVRYLEDKEQNIFGILYDYYDEIRGNSDILEISGEYVYKKTNDYGLTLLNALNIFSVNNINTKEECFFNSEVGSIAA